MPTPKADFERCVFINCPFDGDYMPLLRALIFTVIQCGFQPRIATESGDGGEVRVKKISELMGQSRYSIHDISRIEPLDACALPRFNMPFELGMDFGCREHGPEGLKSKRFLILEKERYRYREVLSDIAGNDIKAHGNEPLSLVRAVRTWFAENDVRGLASHNRIWDAYNEFLLKLTEEAAKLGYEDGDYADLAITELVYLITLHAPPTRA